MYIREGGRGWGIIHVDIALQRDDDRPILRWLNRFVGDGFAVQLNELVVAWNIIDELLPRYNVSTNLSTIVIIPPEIFEIEDEKFFSKFCYAKLIFRGWISLGGRKREKDEKSISILRYSNRKNSYTNCINSGGTLLPLETSFFVNRYQKYCEKLERFGRATPLFQFLSSIFSPGKWDLFTRFKRLTFVV